MKHRFFERLFGYSELWFATGVLTAPFLRAQLRNFRAEKVHHSEHYRYQAFLAYAKSSNAASPMLLDLIMSESDINLKESMVIMTLRSNDHSQSTIGPLTEIILQDKMWSAKQTLMDVIIVSDIESILGNPSRWPMLLKLSNHALDKLITSSTCSPALLEYLSSKAETKRNRNKSRVILERGCPDES